MVVDAIAGLRLRGKGANKTPPDRAVLRARKTGCGQRVRRSRAVSSKVAVAVGSAGELAAKTRKDVNVTTITSAEPTRRDFLYIATGAIATIGAVAAVWPLISQMNPDASTLAAGAPIEVDLAPIAEGQVIKVFWRGKPIFVDHRTKKDIDEARAVDWHTLPDPESDQDRVKQGHDQWLVLIGICTHLGCIPLAHQGDFDGWFCPCHGSQYDSSGRIRRGPAPANLALPPYAFVSDTKIRIG